MTEYRGTEPAACDDVERPTHVFSDRAVDEVLAGDRPYDSLNELEQAEVRAQWESRIARSLLELDFEADFEVPKEGWTEA